MQKLLKERWTYNIIGLGILIVLGGCSTAPKEIMTASGQKGYLLKCPNVAHLISQMSIPESGPKPPMQTIPDWPVCMKKAGEICGARGYDVLERYSAGMMIQCKN